MGMITFRRRIADGTAAPSEVAAFETVSAQRQAAMDAAVTEAVDQLKAEGKWDEANVQVTFVPDEKAVANEEAVLAAAGDEEPPRFQVGRVSVFVA